MLRLFLAILVSGPCLLAQQQILPADPEVRRLLVEADGATPEDAEKKILSAIAICTEQDLKRDCAISKGTLSIRLLRRGLISDAQKNAEEALKLAEEIGDPGLQAELLLQSSTSSTVDANNAELCRVTQLALDRARESKNLYVISHALGEKGRCEVAASRFDSAKKLFSEALEIDRLNNYALEPFHLLYDAQRLRSSGQDARLCEQQILKAYDKAIEQSEYWGVVFAAQALADLYNFTGRYTEATAVAERTLNGEFIEGKAGDKQKLLEQVRFPVVRAVLLSAIASAQTGGGSLQRAIKTFNIIADLGRTSRSIELEAGSLVEIAKLQTRIKEYGAAVQSYERAARLWESAKYEGQLRDTLLNLCDVLIQKGPLDAQSAELQVPYTLKLLTLLGNEPTPLRLKVLSNLAVAQAVLKHFADAGKSLDAADRLVRVAGASTISDGERLSFFQVAARIYTAEENPIPAIVKLQQAAVVSRRLHNDETFNDVVIRARKINEIAKFSEQFEADKSQRPLGAIIDGQILLTLGTLDPEHFVSSAQLTEDIARLIETVVQTEAGARDLEEVLIEFGEAGFFTQRIGWPALMRHYISVSDFKNAAAAGAIAVALASGTSTPFEPDIETQCMYAYAAGANGDGKTAQEQLNRCTSAANQFYPGNARLTQLIAAVRMPILHTADPAKAVDVLRELTKSPTASLKDRSDLAHSLAIQGKIHEAVEIWRDIVFNLAVSDDAIDVLLEAGESISWSDLQEAKSAARDFLSSAVAKSTARTPRQAMLRAHYGLARLSLRDKKTEEALGELGRARELTDQADQTWNARLTSLNGDILEAQHDDEHALNAREEARRLFLAISDFNSAISEAQKSAGTYETLGRVPDAIRLLLEAKELADKSGSDISKYWVRYFLANAFEMSGNYILAVRLDKEAQLIAEVRKDPLERHNSALSLAWAYLFLGEWSDAEREAKHASELAQDNKDDSQKARSLLALISVYGDRRSDVKNIELALRYADELRQLPVASEFESALNENLAELYWSSGKFGLAEAAARAAAAHYKKDGNKYSLAQSLLSIAESQLRAGRISDARNTLHELETDAGTVTDLYTTGRKLYTVARFECSAGNLKTATESFDRLFEIMTRFKQAAQNSVERARFSDTYDFVYEDAITCFGDSYARSPDEAIAIRALNASEENRARQFANAWGNVFSDSLRLQLPAQLQDKESSLLVRRQRLLNDIVSGSNPGDIKKQVTEFETLDSQQKQIESDIWAAAPAYAAIKYPRQVDPSHLRLNAGDILLVTKLCFDKAYIWIYERRDETVSLFRFYAVPKPRSWFESKVKLMRDAFNRGVPDAAPVDVLTELFETLFPDQAVQQKLSHSGALLIVPDNVLTLVPFEALSSRSKLAPFPFVETPISYFPSVAAVEFSRSARAKKTWGKSLFAVGDPIISGKATPEENALLSRGLSLDRIPATAAEVHTIAKGFSAGDVVTLLGTEAKKSTVQGTDLSQFRYLHFATHGLLPTDSGLVEPALVFSGSSDQIQNITLQMSEILSLRLQADLVVLSACNTGSGRLSKAEGVANLGRAFMTSGATSAIVSLWQVADDSTAIFMQQVYASLRAGSSKAQALAAARKKLRDEGYSSPFYWAAFELLGD